MAIEGNLAHVGLADICQLLAMGRKTGCLTVSNRPSYGNVYFAKGRVIYASVLNRPDRLGDLLVKNGVITEEQLTQGIDAQGKDPGRRLGEILMGQGSLVEEDLNRFVTLQIEEAVYHLFGWSEGTFRFEPDEAPPEEVMLVSINAEGLLLEGARRVDEWSLIEKKISDFDLIFSVEHLPDEDDADVELTDNQRRILPLLDGERTVEDLVEASGLVEFDTAKALFGLAQAGFVSKTGQRIRDPLVEDVSESSELAPAYHRTGLYTDAAYQDSLKHLDALDESVKGRPGVLKNRALALEHLGRLEEAESVLDKLLARDASDADAALSRAIVALKRGDPTQARRRLSKARRLLKNGAPPLYYAYGVLAAAMMGDLDSAAAVGEEGLRRYPEDTALLVNLGGVRERQGKPDSAEELYLKAVSLPNPTPQAHKNLGDFAFRRGDVAGARAHFEKAVNLDPRLGDDVYAKLGAIALREDDVEWARMLWQRALELNPENEAAKTGVAGLEKATSR
jgi:tetratricopeptide (TPR) repeat protein